MQPQYPPVPTAYPPQFPQQPAYPAQQQAPVYPPQYAPQPVYQYPPAGYPQQPPVPPAPVGTLDDYYDQPASGGPSFKFKDKPIGTQYAGIVARPITNADVRAQLDNNDRPSTYKDGRPKFVLVVPMIVQPSAEFTDGQAGWWVKGQARDELARAMAEAGAPAGPPEAGAGIRVTLVGIRPVPNMNPAFQYRVDYIRPSGGMPLDVTQPAEPQYANPAVYLPPVAQPQYAPAAQVQQPMPPMAPPPVQAAPVPMPQPAPAQTAPAPAATPPGLSEDQAALFAKLTGG